MGTWGAGTFESDAALDFVDQEIDRHVRAIEDIFADEARLRLDEDAEGELMPRIEMLVFLCEQCGGALPESLNVPAWKTRYLAMYYDQVDELEPTAEYKQQRQAVIENTFDRLIKHCGK